MDAITEAYVGNVRMIDGTFVWVHQSYLNDLGNRPVCPLLFETR